MENTIQPETIRAKCLQYTKNGNGLTEKLETLKQYATGIYYAEGESWNGQPENIIFFECGGVYWRVDALHPNNMDFYRAEIEKMRANFFANVLDDAKEGKHIRLLEIEIFRRLKLDVAPLLSARSAYLKKYEEEQQRKAEEVERKERERAEREANEKAEKIADGVKKIQEKCGEVDASAVELIAEKYGIYIHGRTLGMMREKRCGIVYIDGKIFVKGYKITSANVRSFSAVIDEIIEKIGA